MIVNLSDIRQSHIRRASASAAGSPFPDHLGMVRRNSRANPKVVWLVVDLSRSPATGESLANMGHRLFLHRLECGVSPLAPGLLVLVA